MKQAWAVNQHTRWNAIILFHKRFCSHASFLNHERNLAMHGFPIPAVMLTDTN